MTLAVDWAVKPQHKQTNIPDCKRTAHHIPLSPPSPNSHLTYLPYIHPTQIHSRANSTPTNPTRPLTIYTFFRILSHHRHTIPYNQTHSLTSTQPIYPTIPTPHIIVPSKPSPLLLLYAHPATKTLISPNKAHMS